ncbi:ferrochelatase [Psychromonas sp. RZ22]|uniref:ferrochelatase n=1 Tax=Psychromonas algarum TaxID=2555643 RepID=UPI001067853C|nr:ferrochelatase [Psychromonas sp. RZ22]TEW56512.1 ferrochelatase [Psychromonas sp. RZ22]
MSKKCGVLLVNLGTPEQPSKKHVREFLRDFLSDKRVVDTSRWIWLPILYLIILPIRSVKVAKLYQKIWTNGESPLRFYTQSQSEKLAQKLAHKNIQVNYAMTYGKPSIAEQLQQFEHDGIEQLTVLPLYPQYSVSTTAPVFDQLSDAIKQQFNFPELHFIHNYHDHPLYIKQLVDSIKHSWEINGRSECLVFSFHGIPKRYVTLGDVYQQHCEKTVSLVVECLQLETGQYKLCYQSRVGREEWLKPYLDVSLPDMVKQGIESIDIISPAFSCDCLETLEELAIENRDLFLASGGKAYHYIPCANDNDAQIALFADLVT